MEAGNARSDTSAATLDRPLVAPVEPLIDLTAAARGGDAAAMTMLAARLLVGKDAPADVGEGLRLLQTAARGGHGEALSLLATLTSAGGWIAQSWGGALDLLQQAAERGHGDARRQILLIAGDRDFAAAVERDAAPEASVWRRLKESTNLERFVQPPRPQPVCDAPRIWTAEKFATPAECDWLIGRARGKLRPAMMYDRDTGRSNFNAIRNNSDYFFNIVESGVLLNLIRVRISLLVSLPVPHMEPPQILHYAPGQELRAHFDFLRDNQGEGAVPGTLNSDRVVTFLLYLNTEYEGGHTHFIHADYRYRGAKGDAIFFANLKGGEPDRMSLHSGTPIETGEKYLMSQWIHDKPFVSL